MPAVTKILMYVVECLLCGNEDLKIRMSDGTDDCFGRITLDIVLFSCRGTSDIFGVVETINKHSNFTLLPVHLYYLKPYSG